MNFANNRLLIPGILLTVGLAIAALLTSISHDTTVQRKAVEQRQQDERRAVDDFHADSVDPTVPTKTR